MGAGHVAKSGGLRQGTQRTDSWRRGPRAWQTLPPAARSYILLLPFSSCVTLDSSLSAFQPWFPHLQTWVSIAAPASQGCGVNHVIKRRTCWVSVGPDCECPAVCDACGPGRAHGCSLTAGTRCGHHTPPPRLGIGATICSS